MQTLHAVLKRGGLFWDKNQFPKSIFQERLRLIQDVMAEVGDDVWLVYGDGQRYGDLAYVTHYVTRYRAALAFIPAHGDPVLFVNAGSRDIPWAKTLTWVDEVRPSSKLMSDAAHLLDERKLRTGRIGLVGTNVSLPFAEWKAMCDDLPEVQWSERDESYRALRAARDAADQDGVRRAASVVQAGLSVAAQVFRAGVSVRQAAALVDKEMRLLAAEDVRVLVASGTQVGEALRPPDDRVLCDNDVILLFVAGEVQRYWSEAAQTLVLGSATGETRNLTIRAESALSAMQDTMRDGIATAEVAAAARTALRDSALVDSALMYGLGHGIGLDVEQQPTIRADSAESFAAGDSIALHVVLHHGGIGAAVGRTVMVGASGSTSISESPALVEFLPTSGVLT